LVLMEQFYIQSAKHLINYFGREVIFPAKNICLFFYWVR